MGELGLTTITATFTQDGSSNFVMKEQSHFNVQSSMVMANNWIFQLQDDGPHPGGLFSFGPCTPGAAVPQLQVSFSSTPVTDAQGLPHGADGHPAVPLVNGPVTVVNALPAQFQAASAAAGLVAPPPAVVPATPTVAP
ncbi:hypothetical protein HK101_001969, partial [Irineochytrium annulatum]